jgi:hypothetical protein
MGKITIEIDVQGANGKVELLSEGKPIPFLHQYSLSFDQRVGKLELTGKRFKTDEKGHCVVDPDTKDTASEDVNLLAWLDSKYRYHQLIQETQKQIELILWNIWETSKFNTRKLFEKYGV